MSRTFFLRGVTSALRFGESGSAVPPGVVLAKTPANRYARRKEKFDAIFKWLHALLAARQHRPIGLRQSIGCRGLEMPARSRRGFAAPGKPSADQPIEH